MLGNQIHHGKQLKEYLGAKGINLSEIERSHGILRQYFYKWFDRETLDTDLLQKLRDVTGFVVNEATDVTEVMNAGNIRFVPLKAVAGFLSGYEDVKYVESLQRFFLPGIVGEHYAFEIEGMSMYDIAYGGDWAIAAPEEKLDYMRPGRMYILQTVGGILLKYFDRMGKQSAWFRSHNPEFKPIEIPLKEIKKIYLVNRIVKKV